MIVGATGFSRRDPEGGGLPDNPVGTRYRGVQRPN